jgi:hypothetical protein
VAGHGRVLAARKLGLAEVPVIVLAHLTPTQRRALMIADNRIAENAGWNDELLEAELAALREKDVDLALLGFDENDIERLLAGTIEESEGSDEAPAPPADPISRPGDLWICGEHRCYVVMPLSSPMSRGPRRRTRGHVLYRSALQRQLRELGGRQASRQESRNPQRCAG